MRGTVRPGPSSVPPAALALLALALAGCAGSRAPSDGGPAAPPIQPATIEQLHEVVRAPGARAVLVNVWATWCVPCREEFPDLLRVGREYRERGVRLVLVSADFEADSAVVGFLAAHGVDFLTYLKQGDDMRFIEGLHPDWTGALPATVLYETGGRRLWFRQGKTTYDTLRTRIEGALAASPGPAS